MNEKIKSGKIIVKDIDVNANVYAQYKDKKIVYTDYIILSVEFLHIYVL